MQDPTPERNINAPSTGDIYAALRRYFGFETFKGNQEAIIRTLLQGRDIFVLMPTGGGKSLCYQLPALMSPGVAIIISPLIALMKNQVDAMCQYAGNDAIAHFLNSSLSRSAANQVRADVVSGKTKMLYVAPESLTKEENIKFLQSVPVSFYAVDEAHCISEWGHDFRPEYRRIRPIIKEIGLRPVIALTATATPKVQHDVQKNLGMTDAAVFKSSFNRTNLYYEVRYKNRDTDRDLVRFIRNNAGKSGIVYCLSRKRVEELAEMLRVNDIRALPYHAGLDAATRSANQDAFLHEEADVIVATIAFGMGIDKPDVRFVVHYDIPKSLEGYYQETGRAGRDGGEGRCIAYYSPQDIQKLEKLIQGKPVPEQEISRQLLSETQYYAESSVCRRKILLHYFGEKYEVENCGNCDNCLHPRKKVEFGQELQCAIEAVIATGQRFRAEYIVNVLVGRRTDEIRGYKHHELDVFGSCSDVNERLLGALMRQAVIAGYFSKGIENYGILQVTETGQKFLEHPGKFYVVEDAPPPETPSETPRGGGAADMELFAILKNLCRDVAKRHDLPPYVIFQDPLLEAMATVYPITEEELQNIPGIGQGKARRYGKEFLKVIKQYVEANEIERPEDIRVRQVPSRSKVKLQIISAIDRKISLDVLAESLRMNLYELVANLEQIVYSGTKVNIDYYLEEAVDEDHIDDILDYLRHSEKDDLVEAYKALDGECSEEEIRLVRIKFISEAGN